MTAGSDVIAVAVYIIEMACWVSLAVIFLLRKRSLRSPREKHDSASLIGVALQALSYAIVLSIQRPRFTPIAPLNMALEGTLAVITVLIAAGSVWLTGTAMRTLGKHWSITARLVQGHRLVTEGPYRFVRHPIYTALFGMLLVTGLAVSRWIALPPAILVYGIGTAIRVRSEEKLLQAAFGSEFEDYTRHVPAVIPRLR